MDNLSMKASMDFYCRIYGCLHFMPIISTFFLFLLQNTAVSGDEEAKICNLFLRYDKIFFRFKTLLRGFKQIAIMKYLLSVSDAKFCASCVISGSVISCCDGFRKFPFCSRRSFLLFVPGFDDKSDL